MASNDERTRAFDAARAAELKRLTRIQRDSIGEIERQLNEAAAAINEALKTLGDGVQRRRLEELQREVAQAIEGFDRAAKSSGQDGVDLSWAAGTDLIRVPLAAAGVDLATHLNLNALTALKSSLTHLIDDVSVRTIDRINAQLAQVMIGTQPASDALTQIQGLLGRAARQRARTILYTELGRAYSVASQSSLEDAAEQLPGLHKRWVKSGKLHPRPAHVHAHGQLRPVDEPFVVDGEKLMYPRDPKASAHNTINCGCLSIPVTDGSTWGASYVRLDPFDANTKTRLQLRSQPAP